MRKLLNIIRILFSSKLIEQPIVKLRIFDRFLFEHEEYMLTEISYEKIYACNLHDCYTRVFEPETLVKYLER